MLNVILSTTGRFRRARELRERAIASQHPSIVGKCRHVNEIATLGSDIVTCVDCLRRRKLSPGETV